MYKGIIVGLPILTIVENFLLLELGNLDMVLEIQWLRKQGIMTVNWKALTMTFIVGDTKVILKKGPLLDQKENILEGAS